MEVVLQSGVEMRFSQNILDAKAPACKQCSASLSVLGAPGTPLNMKPWGNHMEK